MYPSRKLTEWKEWVGGEEGGGYWERLAILAFTVAAWGALGGWLCWMGQNQEAAVEKPVHVYVEGVH